MHEHIWNCLRLVSEELNRLQAYKADCVKRGQSGADIQGQIDELLVRREHLQRALCTSLTANAMAEPTS
jgi:hypothetical protein